MHIHCCLNNDEFIELKPHESEFLVEYYFKGYYSVIIAAYSRQDAKDRLKIKYPQYDIRRAKQYKRKYTITK